MIPLSQMSGLSKSYDMTGNVTKFTKKGSGYKAEDLNDNQARKYGSGLSIGGGGMSGSGAEGSGLKLTGSGCCGSGLEIGGGGVTKSIGIALTALAGIGGLTNPTPAGVIGASAIGGLGAYLTHKGKGMEGTGVSSTIMKHIVKHATPLIAKHHPGQVAMNLLKKHINTPVHIEDIFGSNWKEKGRKLIKHVVEHIQRNRKGNGILQDIGKHAKKGLATIKRFAAGNTKLKPSDLTSYLGTAVGALGTASAFVPGLDLISVPATAAASAGLATTSKILKQTGRGLMGEGPKPAWADPAKRAARLKASNDARERRKERIAKRKPKKKPVRRRRSPVARNSPPPKKSGYKPTKRASAIADRQFRARRLARLPYDSEATVSEDSEDDRKREVIRKKRKRKGPKKPTKTDEELMKNSHWQPGLQKMTVKQLKRVCRMNGIRGYSKLKKAVLIKKILARNPDLQYSKLKDKSTDELKKECKEEGIPKYESLSKGCLVALLTLNRHRGKKGEGIKFPVKFAEWLERNPKSARFIANKLKRGSGDSDSETSVSESESEPEPTPTESSPEKSSSKISTAFRILGSAAKMAYKIYKFCKDNNISPSSIMSMISSAREIISGDE